MRIQNALMKLLLSQPFYGSIATALSLREAGHIPKLEMSLFPAPVLAYNREWFERLSDARALGALLHELLHLLLLHALRRNGRDTALWAVCCDMAANYYLLPEMLLENAVTTERIAERLKHELEPGKSAEHYYVELSRILDGSFSLMQRENTVSLPFGDGSALESERFKEEPATHMQEQALRIQLQELVDKSHRSGDIAPELMRELDTIYQRTGADWRSVFKRFINHRGRIQAQATYKRQSRRFEEYPGHKRSTGLRLLVALDESGSISDKQFLTFLHELMEISRGTGAEMLVTEFDTECAEPRPPRAYRHRRSREKKGGTDFRPVFALADRLRISLVLVFTDGQGTAPAEVNQRVLWVLTNDGKQPAAYGDSVRFE